MYLDIQYRYNYLRLEYTGIRNVKYNRLNNYIKR